MNLRVSLLSALAFTTVTGLSHTAVAADIGFAPRLEAGILDYSFESEGFRSTLPAGTGVGSRTFSQESFEYSDAMFFVGGGLTFFADRFFVDLSAQKAFDGSDSDNAEYSIVTDGPTLERVNGTPVFGNISSNPNFSTDFDRVDYAISFGYAVTDNFSVFAGYKYAKTDFDADVSGPFSFAVGGDIVPGVPIGDPGVENLQGEVRGKAGYEFEYDGPFIGATYGWGINSGGFFNGLLSANIAVAFLDGEVESTEDTGSVSFTTIDGVAIPDDLRDGFMFDNQRNTNLLDSEGDTLGVTFGLGWRGFTPVDGLTYSLGFSAYQYSFDADNSDDPDIRETAITYKAGLSYSF